VGKINWDIDGRRERVRDLRRAGYSTTQILPQLDFLATRNAVIGVLFRMKEPGSPVPQFRKNRSKTPRRPSRDAKRSRKPWAKGWLGLGQAVIDTSDVPKPERIPSMRKAPLRVASGVPAPRPKMKTFAELNYRHCRWIYGDPLKAHGYCGHQKEHGRSYCKFHLEASVYTINNGNSADAIMDCFVKRVGISGNSWRVLAA
jgi:hypothetical protein